MSENEGRSNGASINTRVIEAVADRSGVDELDLPPLFDVIDPDALEQLFATDDGQVSFQYAGHTVTVHADGRVEVQG